MLVGDEGGAEEGTLTGEFGLGRCEVRPAGTGPGGEAALRHSTATQRGQRQQEPEGEEGQAWGCHGRRAAA